MTERLALWPGLNRCRSKPGSALAKTLTSTLTLSQDVDVNGDVDVDSILDLVRGPSRELRILVEESRPMVNVKVDDGLNVYGHVNVNLNGSGQGQGQGQGRRQPCNAPEAGRSPLVRVETRLAAAASSAGGRA
jgi:hypothetical protein